MTSPPARVPSACQVLMSIESLMKRTEPSPRSMFTPPGCRLLGRHARAKVSEEPARTRVRSGDLEKNVLAVDPGRAHEERKLAGGIVNVDGLAVLRGLGDCRRRRGEKKTSAIGLTTPVVKSARIRSLKNAVLESPSVTPANFVALFP